MYHLSSGLENHLIRAKIYADDLFSVINIYSIFMIYRKNINNLYIKS